MLGLTISDRNYGNKKKYENCLKFMDFNFDDAQMLH